MNKYLIFLFIAFSFLFSFDAHAADDDWWTQRQITLQKNREDYAKRVYGYARHSYEKAGDPNWSLEGGSKNKTVVKEVVVEMAPSKGKLGDVAFKRVSALARGTVPGIIGGAAITALIEAVGWVMEDGTYVKYKEKDDDTCVSLSCPMIWLSSPGGGVADAYFPSVNQGNIIVKIIMVQVAIIFLIMLNLLNILIVFVRVLLEVLGLVLVFDMLKTRTMILIKNQKNKKSL